MNFSLSTNTIKDILYIILLTGVAKYYDYICQISFDDQFSIPSRCLYDRVEYLIRLLNLEN